MQDDTKVKKGVCRFLGWDGSFFLQENKQNKAPDHLHHDASTTSRSVAFHDLLINVNSNIPKAAVRVKTQDFQYRLIQNVDVKDRTQDEKANNTRNR